MMQKLYVRLNEEGWSDGNGKRLFLERSNIPLTNKKVRKGLWDVEIYQGSKSIFRKLRIVKRKRARKIGFTKIKKMR